jgi:putative MATE family efflux protein
MTIPMMFGLIMLMSFNLIDTFYVSMLGTQSLAAFSFTFSITFGLISLAIGLGVGVSAVVAKTLGQKKLVLSRQHATIALVISSVMIYSLAFLGLFFLQHIFSLLGASDTQIDLIRQYMTPWFLGSLVIIMPMIGNSVMRASGDTKTPAKIMALGALLNAILDPILIFGFGPITEMGIAGAAIASILASAISCAAVYYKLIVSYKLLGWGYSVKQGVDSAKQILKIALPAAASNMMTPLSSSILIAMVANYGSEAVAAFGVGSRIESFALIVVLALSMSLPPFVSQNYGAQQYQRVRQAYFTGVKFVLIWQAFIYMVIFATSDLLAKGFATDPKVAQLIGLYLMIIPLSHGLVGLTILSNSTLNALHKPLVSMNLNIFRLFLCLLPCAYIGSVLAGVSGIIIGVACASGVVGFIAFAIMVKELNKLKQCQVPLNN